MAPAAAAARRGGDLVALPARSVSLSHSTSTRFPVRWQACPAPERRRHALSRGWALVRGASTNWRTHLPPPSLSLTDDEHGQRPGRRLLIAQDVEGVAGGRWGGSRHGGVIGGGHGCEFLFVRPARGECERASERERRERPSLQPLSSPAAHTPLSSLPARPPPRPLSHAGRPGDQARPRAVTLGPWPGKGSPRTPAPSLSSKPLSLSACGDPSPPRPRAPPPHPTPSIPSSPPSPTHRPAAPWASAWTSRAPTRDGGLATQPPPSPWGE